MMEVIGWMFALSNINNFDYFINYSINDQPTFRNIYEKLVNYLGPGKIYFFSRLIFSSYFTVLNI